MSAATCERTRIEIASLLKDAVADRICSAVQAELGTVNRVLLKTAYGTSAFPDLVDPGRLSEVDEESLFDIASLTKPVVTTAVLMRAVDQGHLCVETRLGELLGVELHPELAARTVADLLQHCSGLIDWLPLYEQVLPQHRASVAGRDQIRAIVLRRAPEPAPRKQCYSDLGFILLEFLLERALGAPLDQLFQSHVAAPLGLESSRFAGPSLDGAPLLSTVATEIVDWRGGLLCGVVHDENAWAMGGVAGHAGLFSTAGDVGRFCRALLRCDAGDGSWIAPATLHSFWDRESGCPGGSYRLGWDTASAAVSNAGREVDRDSVVGHLGFTGTSLWIDRKLGGYVVLLTNRVHPRRDESRIRELRLAFQDLAWRLLRSATGDERSV